MIELIEQIGLPHHSKGGYKVPDVDSGFCQRRPVLPDKTQNRRNIRHRHPGSQKMQWKLQNFANHNNLVIT